MYKRQIIDHSTEVRWLSVKGGGIGANWSKVRSVSDKAPGPMPFIHTIDADMIAYRQGKTRKGSLCAFLDISHPDIMEFIHMRVPTGDVNRKNLNLHHSINIPDEFMRAVERDEMWDLIDPNDETARDTIRARELWETILEIRYRTGEPCIHFITESNRHLPQSLKDIGLRVNSSNLCQEIMLPTNEERTAVCCLSSLNLDKFDEWENTTLVADMITMLDNVLEFFVQHAPDELAKVIMPPVNAGLDYLHSSMRRFWESEFPDSNENLAYWTKKISDITTIGVGSVGLDSDFIDMMAPANPTSIDKAIEDISSNKYELIAVGRALISDPNWVIKMKEGKFDELIPYTKESLLTLY